MSASTRFPRRVKSTITQRVPEPKSTANAVLAGAPTVPWYRTTWFLALASSVALWLPLSPLNWSVLGWVAPIGWLLLIRAEKLPGKRPYGVIYLAGMLHWLLVMEGVRRAYWALYFGWFALAAYLAVYLLLFIGLSRVAVHRLRVPLCIAAPTIWVGLELVRGYAVTGFSMGLLGHTQGEFPSLIQISDLGGAYAVSFVVMFVAAAMVQTAPWWFGRWQWQPALAAMALLACVFGYGAWRLNEAQAQQQANADRSLKVALLQNSVDTIFGVPARTFQETFRKYLHQAGEAAQEQPDTAVMIWPESVFASTFYDYIIDPDAAPSPDWPLTREEFQQQLKMAAYNFQSHAAGATQYVNARASKSAAHDGIPHIVGTTTWHIQNGRDQPYNTALLLSPQGEVLSRYSKQHLVMFGEYIPLGEMFPIIYRLSPMPAGLGRGKEPVIFDVAGYKLSPSICFESTVPHLIRRQVLELEARGETPDMLVCVTNDGWFWGSGVLDLHYKCSIFRAVEHRRSMLVAANTGFSTAIDPSGRVLAVGPRRDVATLHVDVPAYRMASFYSQFGDWFAGTCLLLTVAVAGRGIWTRRRAEHSEHSSAALE